MTQEIWNQFKDGLSAFIRSKIRSTEDAEDILQDVFLKIHQNKHKLKDESRLKAWIYAITRNAITDHYRKIRPLEVHDIEVSDQEIIPADHRLEQCILPFVDLLSPGDRDILMKVEFENWSQKDYAKVFGLGYSATKSKIQRARKKLKEVFLNCCEIQSDPYGNIMAVTPRSCACPAASF